MSLIRRQTYENMKIETNNDVHIELNQRNSYWLTSNIENDSFLVLQMVID